MTVHYFKFGKSIYRNKILCFSFLSFFLEIHVIKPKIRHNETSPLKDSEKKKYYHIDFDPMLWQWKRNRTIIREITSDFLNWTIYDEQLELDRQRIQKDKEKAYKKECRDFNDNLEEGEEVDEDHKCYYYVFTTTPEPELVIPGQNKPTGGGGPGGIGGDLGEIDPNELANALGDTTALAGDTTAFIDKFIEQMGLEWDTRIWIVTFHQLMLFIVIGGRWMIPKNSKVTRDQLSQILMTFIGTAADMLEFVTETGKEVEIRCDYTLLFLILVIWSWSTLQFTLCLTGSGRPTTRQVPIYDSKHASPIMWIEEEIDMPGWEKFVFNPEVWSICSTLFLQDMPFLVMRLYVIFGRKTYDRMLVFFTLKNSIVFILEIYRLVVIAVHVDDDEDEDDDDDHRRMPDKGASRARTAAGGSRAQTRSSSQAGRKSAASRSSSQAKKRSASKSSSRSGSSASNAGDEDSKPKGLFSKFSNLRNKTKKFEDTGDKKLDLPE